MPDKKMNVSELNTILDNEVANSVGANGSLLSRNRALAMEYYLGQPFGNEVDGRSHYVSRDVQDTIEWIMPQLMEIITDGHSVVRFAAQSKDDVEAAKVETAYANYVFFRQNRGWQILHNFVKDALIQKTGIIKHWFDETKIKTTEQYNNISAIQLGELRLNKDLEIVEDTLIDNGDATFDVKVIRILSKGQIRFVNVPQEEFVVSARTINLPDSDFTGHIYKTTLSELKQMGISDKLLDKVSASQSSAKSIEEIDASQEKIARFLDNEENPADNTSKRTDEVMREFTVEDLFIRVDFDGDGIAELRQVMRVGTTVLVNDEVDANIFSIWSPILMPHRLVGRSVSDLIMDIQEIKSNLIRSMLDNVNLQNNGRYGVLDGMVNMNDLLTSRPLGIVRMKVPNAVTRLDTPQLPPDAFNMLGFLDSTREERTGVSKSTQNLDSKALSSNTTNGAVSAVMSAAMGRIMLIAKVLAETGLRDLMVNLHRLIRMNIGGEQIFELTGKFEETDPSKWKDRTDVKIRLGTNHGDKASRFNQLQMTSQDMIQIAGAPQGKRLIDEQKLFNMMDEKVKLLGFEDATLFVNDPSQLPPPQEEGPTPEEQVIQLEQQKLQIEVKKEEMNLKVKEAEMKLDISMFEQKQDLAERKFRHEKALDDANFQLQVEELALEREQDRPVKIGK